MRNNSCAVAHNEDKTGGRNRDKKSFDLSRAEAMLLLRDKVKLRPTLLELCVMSDFVRLKFLTVE